MKLNKSPFNTDVKANMDYYANLTLEKGLKGYGSKSVIINNENDSKVLIRQRYDSDGGSYKIIGKREDILRGNIIKYNDDEWIITSKPEDNGYYNKAIMSYCNSRFVIKTEITNELLVDENDKPILNIYGDEQYEEISTDITVPCFVEYTFYSKDDNAQLPLVEGTIKVTIQYNPDVNVHLNYRFTMYELDYKVTNIDYSKVQNGRGAISFIGKVVSG